MIERIALTLGRCLLGLYFLVPGLSKITGYSDTLAYMQLHNVPFSDLLLPVTIVLQVGGGLALLSGFRIRDTALMLAGLTIAINIGMHDFWNTYPEVSSERETHCLNSESVAHSRLERRLNRRPFIIECLNFRP